jgi:ABC-type bacteriocin/lantibiotic exporter with double-glycine peptidase domain
MFWLAVPHQQQDKAGWCLPACVAMVAAYWQQPLLQTDVANWLCTQDDIGTPAGRMRRLAQRGFDVVYRTGSVLELEAWLAKKTPCILFVRTGELPYWEVDTPHALVLIGIEGDSAYVLDPTTEAAPTIVRLGDLILAWSYSDYTYAVLTVSRG